MARPSKAPEDQAVAAQGVGEPARDDQAARVWTVMRDLAAHYPPPDLLRGALNLGRGTGRVKALLQLAEGPLSVELTPAGQKAIGRV